MEISEEDLVKIKPFFVNYFNKLASDLNTLTAADVGCSLGRAAVLSGKAELMGLLDADVSVASVVEDGKNSGDVQIVFNAETSIVLTGLMMMMGEGIIAEQIKGKKYTEELREGFQEVANQVVGSMNDLVERRLKGGHLHLERTSFFRYGEMPDGLKEKTRYLAVTMDIKVGKYPSRSAYWIISQGFAEPLLEFAFPSLGGAGAQVKSAGGGPGGVDAGVDLSAFADLGVDLDAVGGKPDLSRFAKVGTDPSQARKLGGPADLSGYAGGDEEAAEKTGGAVDLSVYAGGEEGAIGYSSKDNLPMPDEAGGVKVVMTEPPFSLDEEEKVIRAINAMRQDGYRYIGVDREGKLVHIVTQSDLRQLMGPFFGTKAMTARDKAICTVPLSKINKEQTLIKISIGGSIQQAADLMTEFELRVLPVISKVGVLRGFVPIHAVLNYFRKKKQG